MTNGKSKKMEVTPSRTAQHCAQCTAHGRISLLKGHKKVCPFKDCRCVHCVLVNNKRQIMAKQVKLKRLQEKNHARRRRREESNASLCCETVASLPEKKLGKFYQVRFVSDSYSFLPYCDRFVPSTCKTATYFETLLLRQ